MDTRMAHIALANSLETLNGTLSFQSLPEFVKGKITFIAFHKPAQTNQAVVLNFYILNGKLTANEKDFSGLFGPRLNIAGDLAKYVAQVQISSVLASSVLEMAKDVADLILDYLPDQNGKVRAVDENNLDRR